MNPLQLFDLIRFAPIIIILAIAAHQDFRHGEASDKLWIYAPIGSGLTCIELYFIPQLTTTALISIAISVVCAFIMFYAGGWGGADSKALITLAVSTPLTPLISNLVTFMPVFALLFGSLAGMLIFTITEKKTTKYLPLMLIGYLIACLI